MGFDHLGIAALLLGAACARAQVNVVAVDTMPSLDPPPHERRDGDIKAHFVRLKSVVHPDRLVNFRHDAYKSYSAEECSRIGEAKEPLPADPDDSFLAYEDHYITDRFHVTYLQSRAAVGPCKLKWHVYRKVTIESFNGTSCVLDLSRPHVSRNRPNCSIAALQKTTAAVKNEAFVLSKEPHRYAGYSCRYLEPPSALGELAKLHRRCVLDTAGLDAGIRVPDARRWLLLRSETRHDPNGRHFDIMEAERVELGIGVNLDVLLPDLR